MFSFSVLLGGPCIVQTHTYSVWIVSVTLYYQGCGFWPCAAVLYLALSLFKNIKQYFQPAPPGPQLNNSLRLWEKWVEVVQTPQSFRGLPLGSLWNHKPVQVTLKFVAFRFLHSSGTKWSFNLVIYPTCPPVALLDLELGNYTSGLKGTVGEMWFWA